MLQVRIIDTYLGGNKNRWTYAYPWMLKYLNKRYANIIGHQGLARFVDDFPHFRRVIEMYVQCDHRRKLVGGTMAIVPGLNFMPWDMFGFIDNMIDKNSTPFSGPRGNYEGAAHKAEYADAQQAFYSGYVKNHGIKVETIFLPNGLSTLFGPVPAQRADAGVLAMSNLNEFLVQLQHGRFVYCDGAEVLFGAFEDSAFNLGLQCIQSCYREFCPGAELDDARSKCNTAMRATRILIKKIMEL
jgi:hypothetical protein